MKRAAAPPAACVAYALLTLLLTHPLVWHLSSVFPHDAGDPVLNTWLVWWNAHEIPLTSLAVPSQTNPSADCRVTLACRRP